MYGSVCAKVYLSLTRTIEVIRINIIRQVTGEIDKAIQKIVKQEFNEVQTRRS